MTNNLLKTGDILDVVSVSSLASDASPSSESCELSPAMKQQLEEQCGVSQVEAQELQLQGGQDVDALAQQVCDIATEKNVRAVVLLNYSGKGMLQESMKGPLASYVSRHCTRPLVLIRAE
eukprot:jgi/Chrzof1/12466/Cz06g35110.t1